MRGDDMRGADALGASRGAIRGSAREPSNRGASTRDSGRGDWTRCGSMRGAFMRGASMRGDSVLKPGTRCAGPLKRGIDWKFDRPRGSFTRDGGSATRVPDRALPRKVSGARTGGS